MCAVTFYDMYKHKCCFIDSVSCGQLRTDHGARARPVLVLRTRSSLNEHAASIALPRYPPHRSDATASQFRRPVVEPTKPVPFDSMAGPLMRS